MTPDPTPTPEALEALATQHGALPEAYDGALLACLHQLESWLVALHYKQLPPPELAALRRVFATLSEERQRALFAQLPWRANALAMLPACRDDATLRAAVERFEEACSLKTPATHYVLGLGMAEGFLAEVGPRLTPFVLERLRADKTPRVVASLLRVLVALGDDSALRALLSLHALPTAPLRSAALGAGLLGASTSLAPIVHDALDALLASRSSKVRGFAVGVLESLPTTDATAQQAQRALARERVQALRERLVQSCVPAEAGGACVATETPEAQALWRSLDAMRFEPEAHRALGDQLLPLAAAWAERAFFCRESAFQRHFVAVWLRVLYACQAHEDFARLAARPLRVLAGATESSMLWAGFHLMAALRRDFGARLGPALVAMPRLQTPAPLMLHTLRAYAPERFVVTFEECLRRTRGALFDFARNVAWTPGAPADLRLAPLLRHEARTVREAVAMYFIRSPQPDALTALEDALRDETEPGVAVSLREAIRVTLAA